MNDETKFKTCPVCRKVWKTRNDFLDDPDVSIVDYQVHSEELTGGMLVFNHSDETTISVKAGAFIDLYSGPMFKALLTSTDKCSGYCLGEHELRSCPAKCDCDFAREVVQIINDWPKMDSYEKR